MSDGTEDKEKNKGKETPKAPVQCSLPFAPTGAWVLPNDFVRSAIFSALTNREKRKVFTEFTQLAARGDTTLMFKGTQLNQHDGNYFMRALELASVHSVGDTFAVNRNELLQGLPGVNGKKASGRDYEALEAAYTRLFDASIQLTNKHGSFKMRLIDFWGVSPDNDEYSIRVSKEAARLFGDNSEYTFISKAKRVEFATQRELCMWLQGYVVSHKYKHYIPVDDVQALSGKTAMQPSKFREALEVALTELARLSVCTYIEGNKKFVVKSARTKKWQACWVRCEK